MKSLTSKRIFANANMNLHTLAYLNNTLRPYCNQNVDELKFEKFPVVGNFMIEFSTVNIQSFILCVPFYFNLLSR
ncbi:hypothetical protein T4D_3019 [Trichinella pseudospiralis]|uniref:Uncharacterized protein n=1 Tax=Trichinella pseudospiralis TaxID=6337 RepID=A0A0V1FL70_TRIPS|nr:hypothetical protein T4D_3019 [Trichinella pseudospiralis]